MRFIPFIVSVDTETCNKELIRVKRTLKYFEVLLRYSVAIIYAQTLYFKFTASAESVFIFTRMGMEPSGRYFMGCAELLTALMLLFPRTAALAAFISLGMMGGAIVSHLFFIGIDVMDDGGLLFGLALYNTVASILLLVLNKDRLTLYLHWISHNKK